VAGADLLRLLELVRVRVVIRALLRVRDRDPRLELRQVEEEVAQDAALREGVAVLVRVETRAHVGLGHGDAGDLRRHHDVLRLHLLVAAPELLLRLLGAHHHAIGDERGHALAQEAPTHLLLELRHRDALHLQAPAQLVRAHEAAVELELGRGGQALADGLVVDGDAEPARLQLEHAIVDQRLQGLFLEAHALERFAVEAALVEVLVHLPLAEVGLLVFADGDGQRTHLHESGARGAAVHAHAREGGDVSDDEGGDHHPQEDIEPPLVAAHEAEGHALSVWGSSPRRSQTRILCGGPNGGKPGGGRALRLRPLAACDYNAEHSKSLGARGF
jgi:hypothetical protein